MNIHIWRAKTQPATRFVVDVSTPDQEFRYTQRYRRRKLLPCFKCKKMRWAAYLIAHVYYDGTYFFCRPGRGCKS